MYSWFKTQPLKLASMEWHHAVIIANRDILLMCTGSTLPPSSRKQICFEM